jgi:flavin reductase (DIM6/NTAB) family NADH-FMN oxidoreductase RutF
MIRQAGDFVVNVPSSDMIKQTDLCGIVSGAASDKFKLCNFTEEPSSKISSPMIKECPVNIECALRDTVRLGSHDMFIGQVMAIHADSDIVKNGRIDAAKAMPFVYIHGEYWDVARKIGYYGFSRA